jgi:hypothetical protein
MKIDAILFDADGVVQRPFAARRDAWRESHGSGRDVDKFVAAIFEWKNWRWRIRPTSLEVFPALWPNGDAMER